MKNINGGSWTALLCDMVQDDMVLSIVVWYDVVQDGMVMCGDRLELNGMMFYDVV